MSDDKHPHIGEVLYTDEHGQMPVKIVHREGTTVWWVPVRTHVIITHQGNLYDADGEHKYRVVL